MKTRLANNAWRPLFNRQMQFLRSLSRYLSDFPDDESAPLVRAARDEVREFIEYIKADRRPCPPMPHVKRLLEVWDSDTDIEILEWNDRQIRATTTRKP